MPPVTIPTVPTIPPVKLDPIELPPVKIPTIPPVKVDPIGVPPVTIPTVPTIPPVKLDPIELPPVKIPTIPPVKVDPIGVPPVTIPTVPTIPPVKLDPITPAFPAAPTLSGRAPTAWMADSAQPWASAPLATLFGVPRDEPVSYTVSLANGAPLPGWLGYDAAQGRLTLSPGAAVAGPLAVKVKATTASGQSAESALELLVQPGVQKVGVMAKVDVADAQVAIDQSEAMSTVTATGGRHVLLQGGTFGSATLGGSGAHAVTATGIGTKLTTGDGDSTIELLGSGATVTAGGGNNHVTGSDSTATITLGNGDNRVTGAFRQLTVGAGHNVIESTGSLATLRLGDGHDVATLKGMLATVQVGHGTYELDYAGSLGKLAFGAEVGAERLWFQHAGDDLRIAVTGSAETVTLKNWYAPQPDRAGSIVAGDGKTLSGLSVESLVQAMASFAPPVAGATAITPEQQKSLQPVLAANWH